MKLKTQQNPWTPQGWQKKNALQQAQYPDAAALKAAVEELSGYPPLVTSWEILRLKNYLAEVQRGDRFLLQGGDCAESFSDCRSPIISDRIKVLLQMSLVLIHGIKQPVVRIGRFAGQYAKPRSSDMETRDGVELPSYRGDLINASGFTEMERIPDPNNILKGHTHSAMTLNFVRALVEGGFADIRHPEYWDLDWINHASNKSHYQKIMRQISESIEFAEVLAGRKVANLSRVELFSSHEALHLHYEQALTRQVPRQHGWFNLGTHFPWIGLRTNDPESAHVELLRGVRNPIGVKVGKETSSSDLVHLVKTLNPDNTPGRLTLIHRFGAAHIEDNLPRLIETVHKTGTQVLWCADPMHGNTESTSNGYKTRHFNNINDEVRQAFDIHRACDSRLGGVHLELTGENVTECLGGARALQETDLTRAYTTQVDPRLNYEQSLELAFAITAYHNQSNPQH